MPAYSKLTDWLEADKQGQLPLTRRLAQIFSVPDLLKANPHFEAFTTVGHMNVIDDGCREALHLDEAMLAHLNKWPNDLKEQARAAAAEAIEKGQKIEFSWHMTRSRSERVRIVERGDVLNITFLSPRSKAPATVKDPAARPVLGTSPA